MTHSTLIPSLVERALVQLLGERVRLREPLARRSSLRIGGVADLWCEPHTLSELVQVMSLARTHKLALTPVGLGSNTLYPDEGLRGVVVRLGGQLASWQCVQQSEQGCVLEVGAGCINAHLVRGALKQGFVGAEFLVLIPGTFGGAVVMNAGTREAELSSILESVDLLLPGEQLPARLSPAELGMRYRHAELPAGALVVSGRIRVHRGDVTAASQRAKQDRARRNLTQPYKLASVGSTFANPEGDHAGRLIEAAGLKGYAHGGARISALHANFFINEQDASAHDFLTLMATARHKVRTQFGVELVPEVRFVGFDGWAELARLEQELEARDA